jgi:hypothetical protein
VWKLVAALLILTSVFVFFVWRSRRKSILDVKGRNRHFESLAKQLQLVQKGDDYFTQLEGTWNGTPVLIYPHNFEGPGSITLFYLDSGILCIERNWIEPNLSLGRAIVEWKRKVPFHHEVSGSELPAQKILEEIESLKQQFPYIAITQPTRFIFSHYMMESLSNWKNFVILLVLDAGRKPSFLEIQNALNAGVRLAQIMYRTTESNGASRK